MVQLTAINGTFVVLVPAAILLAAGAGDFGRFLTDFLFYVIFSAFTTTVMSKVMYSSEALMMAEDSMRRVNEILAVAPMEEVAEGAAAHPAGTEVALENVTFAYPGSARPALRDVSLTVPAGATVALVGPSGGGKSTLASLVPRFWDPQEGVVAVGGADVRRIPAAELMDTVAFVFQNDRLFKGTLADNIRMGRPDASDEDVAAAARAAQCDDIIAKFPEGLATRVGADGVYLSGGECQRIALARAILKDAPVVVLDEATAFADPENEALIQQALGRLAAGKTVLIDRAPAVHGGGRRPHRRGGRRRHRGARHPRRAAGPRRHLRAPVEELLPGRPMEDRGRERPMLRDRAGPDRGRRPLSCGKARSSAPWPTSCSCSPSGCSTL